MKRAKILFAVASACAATLAAQSPKARLQFPDAPGKETVQKVCGSCHGAEVIVPKGLTRQQWGDVIASMVTRGAKGTDEEFAQVLDYLATNFPPSKTPAATASTRSSAPAGAPARRGPSMMGAGADDKHVVDPAAADRGRTIYIAECITCHGNRARGGESGPDLVRSLTVLHDRYGNAIGPFLLHGHPMQSGRSSTTLTSQQIADLSHFLHQRVYDTLRSGPYSQVINVLTGDAAAGRTYFNGAGRCNSCHSPAGDLAGIAKKYDPAALQQRFLFPQTVGFGRGGRGVARTKPVTVTVTPRSGVPVSGTLVSIDDFNVSLRDASGEYHCWKRTPDLKVQENNPYAAHIALLDQYTDKNIHDLVAYLETLK
jgi:mono/diheme cytochrome c family protein